MSQRRALSWTLRGVATCVALYALGGAAAADEPGLSDAARAAYDRGTKAYERGEYAVAASEFASADALAPHPVALKWALTAAVKADDAVLGMTLVQRSERAAGDAHLAAAVRAARQKFERRVGSVTVVCPNGVACEARIDGAAAKAGQPAFVMPGSHMVETTSGRRVERQWTTVAGGAAVRVDAPGEAASATPPVVATAAPAPRTPPPRAPERDQPEQPAGGISPAWYWVGVGVTTALGGATVASGVDTLSKHDDYLATRQPGGDEPGRDAQLRTNVLIAATAAVGVATAAVGLFAVRWSSETTTRTRRAASRAAGRWIAPTPVGVVGRF